VPTFEIRSKEKMPHFSPFYGAQITFDFFLRTIKNSGTKIWIYLHDETPEM